MRVVAEIVVFGLLVLWFLWWRTTRRSQERARAHARFRAVYSAIPVGVLEIALDHRILSCNAGFASMVGLPADRIVGRYGWDFFHEFSPAADRSAVEDLVAGRVTALSGEGVLQGPQGAPVAVKTDWAVIESNRGEDALLICAFTDIRAQVDANAELRVARERAEVLWQRAPVGVLETTPDGVIVSSNDAFDQMLGHPAGGVVGRHVADLADPVHSPEIDAGIELLGRGVGYTAERRYLSSDGRSVPVHVSTAVLHDEHDAVSRLAGFYIDMSEINAQRAALVDALADASATRDELTIRQGFTEALLETVEVGIVSCDASGTNVSRNRALRAMLGHPAEEGQSPGLPSPAIDLRDAGGSLLDPGAYPLARALRGEVIDGVDLKIGPEGGPYRDIVVRASQISTPDGLPGGAVVASTDVTSERRISRELAVEHSRLNEAQRLGQLGSFSFDVASGEFSFSEQIYRIWGLPPGADLASRRLELIHPDDLHRVIHGWSAALAAGGQHATAYRIVRPDGSTRHLRVALEVLLGEDGEPVSLHGTHQDVTELTLAQREAVEASTLFQAVLTATPDLTFVTDIRTGGIVYASPGKTILGLTSTELEELGPSIIATLVHPDEQPRLRAANEAAVELADGEVLQMRYQVRHVNGSWHWLSRRVTPFRRDETTGAVVEVLGVVRDVTDVVEAEERLTYTALHDPLTGLPNRSLLMDRLNVALERSRQRGREVAVLFCDLDGFKRVNDTTGHATGDKVLIETASRIQSVLREHDTVARVGGDEFVVVAEPWNRPETELDVSGASDPEGQAQKDRAFVTGLAGRITEVLRQPVVVDDLEHVVTVSIGITYAGPSTATASLPLTADLVLQNADAAMYRAKHSGKDRFEIFEHGLRTDLAERGRVEHVLRQALARDASAADASALAAGPTLTAAYQPIVEGRGGALMGFEALARLTDANGLSIPPDVFVKVAEDTALIRPLGAMMLDLACRQLAAWRRELPALQGVTMAVNVSALEAQHASWGQDVRGALSRHGLVAGDLVLELTETAVLQAAHSTLSALRSLRADGVGIALDDFGTGYASLRYLTTLPVSAVKIDRSFTAGLPHDQTSRKIVSAVVGLAEDLDLVCVVEGVETREQRLALPDGVHIQGWLTGRPAAAEDLDVLRLMLAEAPT